MANEKRNASIDITKFILALIVVMLHSATECLGTEHMAVRVIEYSGRFVVQFFLMVSGYYFTKMLVEKGTGFLRFFVRMMKIYLLWSAVYISLSFAVNVLLNGENAGEAVLGYVKNFFFVGSYWHLWYMVGLIYALCLTTLFYKIAKERGLRILLGAVSYVLYSEHSAMPIRRLWSGSHGLDRIWMHPGFPRFQRLCVWESHVLSGDMRWFYSNRKMQ